MRFWIRVDQKIKGPFSSEELAAQGAPESTLVCPEGRARNRRENWLPLRKAKEPARFYIRVGSRLRGPLPAPELKRLAGFCGDTLVCPERKNFRNRWNWAPAGTFAGLLAAKSGAEDAPAPGHAVSKPAAPAEFWAGLKSRWRRPPTLPLAAGATLLIVGTLLWMKYSYLPRVRQTYLKVHASMDLAALAILQERYRRQTGTYADDLVSLAAAAGDPQLPDKLAQDIDLQTLLVRGTSSHYVLEANSLDEKRTLIGLKASAPPGRPKKDAGRRTP
jgi:hypothetical protein